MAFLRRRKQPTDQPAEPVAPPQPSPQEGGRRTDSGSWLPPEDIVKAGPAPPESPAEWVPEALPEAPPEQRTVRPRSGSISLTSLPTLPPESEAPPPEPAAAPEPVPEPEPAPAPASTPGPLRPRPSVPDPAALELRERIAALEAQIAEAQRNAAEVEARPHETADEVAADRAAVDRSYAELQAAVAELRTRVEQDTGSQRATIESLNSRLAGFEQQLRERPAAYGPSPGTRAATGVRVLVMIALFLVIAGAPLFMARRETCHTRRGDSVHWSFVKPFDDKGPARCKNELGGTVILNAVGL